MYTLEPTLVRHRQTITVVFVHTSTVCAETWVSYIPHLSEEEIHLKA